MTVRCLRALEDNYVYLVVDEAGGTAAVVDASEAAPVVAELRGLGLRPAAIWSTHHHLDHVGGNEELAARFPGLAVYGSDWDLARRRVPGQTVGLADGDSFQFAGARVTALRLPGHTLGAIAYHTSGVVFTGDTLFPAGCGRLFEGTPEQMFASLARLAALPAETVVLGGHEYSRQNLAFAAELDPDDAELRARRTAGLRWDEATIGAEKRTNPFLRAATAGAFAELRRRKDAWRESPR